MPAGVVHRRAGRLRRRAGVPPMPRGAGRVSRGTTTHADDQSCVLLRSRNSLRWCIFPRPSSSVPPVCPLRGFRYPLILLRAAPPAWRTAAAASSVNLCSCPLAPITSARRPRPLPERPFAPLSSEHRRRRFPFPCPPWHAPRRISSMPAARRQRTRRGGPCGSVDRGVLRHHVAPSGLDDDLRQPGSGMPQPL